MGSQWLYSTWQAWLRRKGPEDIAGTTMSLSPLSPQSLVEVWFIWKAVAPSSRPQHIWTHGCLESVSAVPYLRLLQGSELTGSTRHLLGQRVWGRQSPQTPV